MEFAVPVWNGGLSEEDSEKIEKIQKKVFKILLSQEYTNYEDACSKFKTLTLKDRRENLCLKFARKDCKKENSLFNKFTAHRETRKSKKTLVHEYSYHSTRYFKGGLPYLARLLNLNATKKQLD